MHKELYNLKNSIKDNDKSFIFNNFFDDYNFISWEDVNYAINTGKYYTEILDNKEKVNVPCFKYFWHNHINQDKKFIFDSINNGKTFVIHQFSLFNKNLSNLVKEIESIFPVRCDVHVYGGIGNGGSFNPHVDIPSNFIIQIDGSTEWKIYSNYSSDLLLQEEVNTFFDESILVVENEVLLEPGDMLYIPARKFHAAFPKGKRLSLSIPCRSIKYEQEYSFSLDRNFYRINYGN